MVPVLRRHSVRGGFWDWAEVEMRVQLRQHQVVVVVVVVVMVGGLFSGELLCYGFGKS